jgi:hypothetical protein
MPPTSAPFIAILRRTGWKKATLNPFENRDFLPQTGPEILAA